jgi:hypothetical protein
MICRTNSNIPLPELYFKKSRYNHLSYLPKDFQIKLKPIIITASEILSNKRISERENQEENSSNKRKRKISTNNQQKKRKSSQSIVTNEDKHSSKKKKPFKN